MISRSSDFDYTGALYADQRLLTTFNLSLKPIRRLLTPDHAHLRQPPNSPTSPPPPPLPHTSLHLSSNYCPPAASMTAETSQKSQEGAKKIWFVFNGNTSFIKFTTQLTWPWYYWNDTTLKKKCLRFHAGTDEIVWPCNCEVQTLLSFQVLRPKLLQI